MDQKLKERLLGAIIILSVFVWCLPKLFTPPPDPKISDHKLKDWKYKGLAYKTKEYAVSEDKIKALQTEETLDLEAKLKQFKKEIASKKDTKLQYTQKQHPTLSPKPLDTNNIAPNNSWVLKLGVFSNPVNARALVKQLSAKGYKVYTQVDVIKGVKMTRVLIGPKKTELEINQIQSQIKRDFKIQGIALNITSPHRGTKS